MPAIDPVVADRVHLSNANDISVQGAVLDGQAGLQFSNLFLNGSIVGPDFRFGPSGFVNATVSIQYEVTALTPGLFINNILVEGQPQGGNAFYDVNLAARDSSGELVGTIVAHTQSSEPLHAGTLLSGTFPSLRVNEDITLSPFSRCQSGPPGSGSGDCFFNGRITVDTGFSVVPEPASVFLMASGLGLLAFLYRRKKLKLYLLTSSKQIPHKKCGGLLRFFEHELIAWLDKNHEGPKAA